MGNKSPPSDWTYPLEDIVREILAFYRGISDLFHKKGKKKEKMVVIHIFLIVSFVFYHWIPVSFLLFVIGVCESGLTRF